MVESNKAEGSRFGTGVLYPSFQSHTAGQVVGSSLYKQKRNQSTSKHLKLMPKVKSPKRDLIEICYI